MLFSGPLFYEYMGVFSRDALNPSDNLSKILAFARKGYLDSISKGKIPISVDPWDKLWSMLVQEIEESGGFHNVLLILDDSGTPNYQGIAVLYAMPLLTLLSLFYICCKSGKKE